MTPIFPWIVFSFLLTISIGKIDCSRAKIFQRFGSESALKGHVVSRYTVFSLVECGLNCLSLQPDCKSFNYVEKPSGQNVCEINNSSRTLSGGDDFVHEQGSEYFEIVSEESDVEGCSAGEESAGPFKDGPWTLIARFSNSDEKRWMKNGGQWWYDRTRPGGDTLDPSNNTDMISEAFWLLNGSEFRITKSDDPTHTALLTTTGNCLGGKSFRSKLTSYGIFRYKTSWASNACLGNCSVKYGGNYTTVRGFRQSQCNGSIHSKDGIGFWCGFEGRGAAVLMIGGGGKKCNGADHGIGITEHGSFKSNESNESKYDFGDNAKSSNATTVLYSLNLWVR